MRTEITLRCARCREVIRVTDRYARHHLQYGTEVERDEHVANCIAQAEPHEVHASIAVRWSPWDWARWGIRFGAAAAGSLALWIVILFTAWNATGLARAGDWDRTYILITGDEISWWTYLGICLLGIGAVVGLRPALLRPPWTRDDVMKWRPDQ